jgi:protein involved in polysaccharide export with SLBB domain
MNKIKISQKSLLGLIALFLCQLFMSQSALAKTPATTKAQKITKASVQPFGNNLFTGSFQSQRNDGLDPNYRLVPGDKVALHMWGQVTIDETLTVDASGNIFIPEVGQVKVAGLRSTDLPRVVKQKVATVFKEGEDVYINLLTATPISVYVTGAVVRPGQYSGISSNSVLSYLYKAGGIDPVRGSYRDVKVMRGNQLVARYDLYPFLRQGKLKHIKFLNGDTIVVGELASSVTITGDSLNPYRFEFSGKQMTGRQLIQYARPKAKVTHIAVSGARNRKPWSAYLPYNQFLNTRLLDGDKVRFTTDALDPVMGIRVEGNHLGKSFYSIKKGSRLLEVLDYIEVDKASADIKNIYIKRKSIAKQQQQNLQKSIQRLERNILTTPSKSDGEAIIRSNESKLMLQYIEHAKNSVAEGLVVVSENGRVANILLEEGDVIVIPQKSDVITVSGEVLIPQSMVYARNANIKDYIQRAGGFSQRADQQKLVVRRPNGKVDIGNKLSVNPGDRVMVFPKVDPKQRQNFKDWVQIFFQLAVAIKTISN